MQLIKDDIYVGFYELFILWSLCSDDAKTVVVLVSRRNMIK